MKDPENAWHIFEEVSNGILAKDAALNELLTNIYNTEKIEGFKKIFSIAEYYNKVNFFFLKIIYLFFLGDVNI